MDSVEWRFACIIFTFAIIGIICFLKRFKSGILAASTGIVISLGVWGIRELNNKVQSFFSGIGISTKDIMILILCIVASIILFFFLSLLFKRKNNKGRKRRW
ncbi:hypothetical protein [Clostridium tarantellae]|uniref:Uncharacterized protein n=1 Tax=Clostridium tarantellae TaxID=39493 RepID=A0A6I1MT80_9CLOT|nr:hypothetical protein [Clostridium tarantellae]MPQ44071.1 hypothetical protein [Clostridium tarantellae]